MLHAKTRWRFSNIEEHKIQTLVKELGIAPLMARLLIIRGLDHPEAVSRFLQPDPGQFHDPFLLDGMSKSIERVKQAIKSQERIMVYGDYDADGVSSTSLMIRTLRECGATFDYYIPNRFTEGYGLNNRALEMIAKAGYSLVITVDTGISAVEQVEYGKSLGLHIIITDHHEPPQILPDAYAVINPKKPECAYPFDMLAGVGVAFKFAHALLGEIPLHLIDIAAIGTIADLVPLIDENRIIAKLGLEAMGRSMNPGIKALKEVCGITGPVASSHVGFGMGPRINASGRLDSADKAVQLLTTDDDQEALEIAYVLDQMNKERQEIVQQMAEEAEEMVEQLPENQRRVLVVAKEGWNEGVIGIVASRLVEKYYRPCFVFSIHSEKGMAKGSARSIEGFDLYKALTAHQQLLSHYGGHYMAAGMSLPLKALEDFRNGLNELAGQWLTKDDYIPVTQIDTACTVDEIHIQAIENLSQMAPFGIGNPQPLFIMEDIEFDELRTIGRDNSHLKCIVKQYNQAVDGIGFGLGELVQHISPKAKGRVIGELAINEWNGHKKPQLIIRDVCIPQTQVFDFRGTRDKYNKIVQFSIKDSLVVCFRPESAKQLEPLRFHPTAPEIVLFEQTERMKQMIPMRSISNLFLYDMPFSMRQFLHHLLPLPQPERVYCLFGAEHENRLISIPSRDQFKGLYAFLVQKGSFSLMNVPLLAKSRGWSEAAVQFMLDVFVELGFLKREKEWVSIVPSPVRKDLAESNYYQQKKEELLLESELLYSSYEELCNTLMKVKLFGNHTEEEMEYGL